MGLPLTSGGTGFIDFSLNLATSVFEPAFKTLSPSGEISEDLLIDPSRNLLCHPERAVITRSLT
jgi:hypothetical protein